MAVLRRGRPSGGNVQTPGALGVARQASDDRGRLVVAGSAPLRPALPVSDHLTPGTPWSRRARRLSVTTSGDSGAFDAPLVSRPSQATGAAAPRGARPARTQG